MSDFVYRDAEGQVWGWGQCFMCERTGPLRRAAVPNHTGYACAHCGGWNDPHRVEAGLDHQRRPLTRPAFLASRTPTEAPDGH